MFSSDEGLSFFLGSFFLTFGRLDDNSYQSMMKEIVCRPDENGEMKCKSVTTFIDRNGERVCDSFVFFFFFSFASGFPGDSGRGRRFGLRLHAS